MFVILSQVVWALTCLAWTTSAQSDSSDDFKGLYLYMDAKTAQKYYRKCVCRCVFLSMIYGSNVVGLDLLSLYEYTR